MLYRLDGNEPAVIGDAEEEPWIADSATVIGNVHLHPASSVWFGAVIRGDNELIIIGPGSNVQDMAMLHTDPGYLLTIGKGCTVGHKAILHGCTIGDNALIGMGAMVMNGAVIGENCLIGAGALVPERKVIPPNSLVLGAPGQVVRELDEQAINGLELSAQVYQANARRFRAGLSAMTT